MPFRSSLLASLSSALLLFASSVCAAQTTAPASRPAIKRDLTGFREIHPTHLTQHGPVPKLWQSDAPITPPPGVEDIIYQSGDLKLHAWLGGIKPGQQLQPAVVFCHGGFWFGNDDWDAIKPFLKAGYIVLMPRVRAENGNPGEFSFYYNEVDDVIAAGNFLAAHQGVNPHRIFVSGHSAGGVLATFAVMKPSPFILSAPIGAALDVRNAAKWEGARDQQLLVFNASDPFELESRSAVLFTASALAPVHLFRGSADGTAASDRLFVRLAHSFLKPATLTIVEGDHGHSQVSAIPKIIETFDAFKPNPRCHIRLPRGWAPATVKVANVKESGQNAKTHSSFLLYSHPRTAFNAEATLATIAKNFHDSSEGRSSLANRADTDLSQISVNGLPCFTYDATGDLPAGKFVYRHYIMETTNCVVELICYCRDTDLPAAAPAFSALLPALNEITD